MKKLTKAELKDFRDRLYLPIRDADLEGDLPPYYHPGPDSDEIDYMRERRAALGGSLPSRVVRSKPLKQPPREDVRRAARAAPASRPSPPRWPSYACSRS